MGVEKTKVNLENEAAQVEAEKCGVIAKDVTELQARCEKDLAAAEPLVAQAEAALDTLNKKDLGAAHCLSPLGQCHAAVPLQVSTQLWDLGNAAHQIHLAQCHTDLLQLPAMCVKSTVQAVSKPMGRVPPSA